MTINVGVIGAGYHARHWMIPAFMKEKGCVVTCVQGRNLEGIKEYALRESIPRWHTDWRKVLLEKNLDMVYIASPPFLHAEQTIEAALAGKHVLCEKAMAVTVEDCRRMMDACRRANVQLGICFVMRFHSVYERMKALIQQGFLGSPKYVEARIFFQAPESAPDSFRLHPNLGGGGALMDLGVHLVDLLRFLLDGEVEEVSAIFDRDPFSYPSDSISIVNIKFKGGAQGTISVSHGIPFAQEGNINIYGSAGSLLGIHAQGEPGVGRVTLMDANGVRDERIRLEDKYQALVHGFIGAIQSKEPFSPGGSDGLAAQELVLAAYESARPGKIGGPGSG